MLLLQIQGYVQVKKHNLTAIAGAMLLIGALAACNGDDGVDGSVGQNGENGENGVDGQNSTTGLDISLAYRAVLGAESPEGAAEIVQYQKSTGYIYALNSSGDKATIEILDINNASAGALVADSENVVNNTNLPILSTLNLGDNTAGDANSIAISDELELLAVAMAATTKTDIGYVAFYDISGATPSFIKNVAVGALPDMVAFSPDSTKVVVANEGEPSNDYTIDPEGSISIIDITTGIVADTAVNLNFNAYDSMKSELQEQGVVFANPTGQVINGVTINTTVSMDLEPEYVAITEDSSMAYISIQESNAMAVVDLSDNTLVKVVGLGFKDWSQHNIDASDKDNGINFKKYKNLYGMYQPDTIASYRWSGTDFIVSANEGDGREYIFDSTDEASCLAAGGLDFDDGDCLAYTDEIRAEDLTLDAIAFADVNNDDDDLGRLKVTTALGDSDNDGEYEALYTYGARSFSIWDANGRLIFDSGDDVGLITAAVHGENFNSDEDENKGDTRSDAKGAEPEALALGKINDRTYAFVGLERMGGILVYDITNPFNVTFIDYFYNRGTVEGADITGDLAPEGMKFVAETDTSPALLIVGNEISGSVSVWEIALK